METLNHSEKVQDQLTQSMERVSFIDKAEEVHARIGALAIVLLIIRRLPLKVTYVSVQISCAIAC